MIVSGADGHGVTTAKFEFNLMPHEEHHRITVRDLQDQISKLPDDSLLAFIADDTRCQFLGIAPSDVLGVEGVFIVHLRLIHNYPPVSR